LEALNDLKRQVHAGHLVAASGTFTDFLRRWLEVAGGGICQMEGDHLPPEP